MTSDVIEIVNNMLREEKLTQEVIKTCSVAIFDELDNLINEINDDWPTCDKLEYICRMHIKHKNNSIIALYINGLLAFRLHIMGNKNILYLASIFACEGNLKVAKHLCKKILEFGPNRAALGMLAECYDIEGEENRKIETWEKIVKIYIAETDITKALAEKFENDGNMTKAIKYNRIAIYRYTRKQQFDVMTAIWNKLMEIGADDLEFFDLFLKEEQHIIPAEKRYLLMGDLCKRYKENKDWDNAIRILKDIIGLNLEKCDVRNEIIDCFTAKYGELPNFKKSLTESHLQEDWKPINDAISYFEKHIVFAKGYFVFHNDWGIGRIKAVNDDNIVIDFIRMKDHMMNINMALDALNVLPKDHIWVIKVTHKLPELRKMVLYDVKRTLKTIIKSFNNCADLKLIKKELTPGILSSGEWVSWSKMAKKVLMNDPEFYISPENGFFKVLENPITLEEKLFNKFKNRENFYDRFSVYKEYNMSGGAKNEFYVRMLKNFYYIYLHTINIGVKISCWFILNDADVMVSESFSELYSQISDVVVVFSSIPGSHKDLRENFLRKIKEVIPDWPDIFCSLFPYHLDYFIPDTLDSAGYTEKIKDVFKKVLNDFRIYKWPFVWVCENADMYSFTKSIMPSEEKILKEMILLLDITNREIESKKRTNADDMKLSKIIERYISGSKNKWNRYSRLDYYIEHADFLSAKQMLFQLEGVVDLSQEILSDFRNKLKEKYPDFSFEMERPFEIIDSDKIWATKIGLQKKHEEYKHILEEEIPKKSNEVGEIVGQYGKMIKKPDHITAKQELDILRAKVNGLSEMISSAQLFKKANLNLNKVSFGTKVTLLNLDTNENIVYTILGPFESDMEKNIISYQAPLAENLLGSEVGEERHFEINGKGHNVRVLSIEASDLI